MPAENQDFTIHDLDEFQVRFNVTDAVNSLVNGTTSRAWWGVAEFVSDTSPLIQRSNVFWTDPAVAPATTPLQVDFGSTADQLAIASTYIDVLVYLKPLSVTDADGVNIGGSKSLQPTVEYPATYYHECIFSADNNQLDSVGIATGEITVLQSLFTENDYRN
mgnify:CR=1 FL=1|tara:strand:+ start:74 stop:559 length:486 start_codon:yes stop_codon:yes gene_type:complete